jgi:hypothetical protein
MLFAAGLALVAVPGIRAQHRGPGMSRMMHNTGTEITIKGTVDAINQGARGMMMGTHLTVKTADGTTEVMLGPSNFIESQGFTFAKGDEVEITGSKVTMGGTESLIAREVVKGGKTLTLRDKNGVPAWSGGRAWHHGAAGGCCADHP